MSEQTDLTNGNVLRSDRIFGSVRHDLTPDLYRRCGKSLGSRVPEHGKFLIARDCRESSPAFAEALMDGLQSTGVSVVDLGTLPISMLHYALLRTAGDGAAIVTGDDAPYQYNGLRWKLRHLTVPPTELIGNDASRQIAAARRREPRKLDVTYDYVAWFQHTWFDTPPTSLGVVVDPMYGSWASKARRYLQAIFPRMIFSAVRDEPHPTFQGTTPSGRDAERLVDLSRAVDHLRADVGFALDADGGRVTLIDGNGIPLLQEETTWFILDSFGECLEGETVLHHTGCSDIILERLRRAGARLFTVHEGTSFFRRAMRETNALIGLTSHGSYHFRCIFGHDDPLFTICWILDRLAMLKAAGTTLSQWRSHVPRFVITPEISLPVAGLDLLVKPLSKHWKADLSREVDGVKLRATGGWIYLHEQCISGSVSVKIEAGNRKMMNELLHRTAVALDDAGLPGKEALVGTFW